MSDARSPRPSAAPDAVPSTYGSASGLRSRPWNVAPATASADADDHRREHPRQAQVHHDRLGRRRPRRRRRSSPRTDGRGSPRCRAGGIARSRGRRRATSATTSSHDAAATASDAPVRRARRTDRRGAGRSARAPRVPVSDGTSVPSTPRRPPAAVGRGAAAGSDERPGGSPSASAREAVHEARPGPGDDDVVDRPDRAVLDRRHRRPSPAGRDLSGGHAVGRVAEDDHLAGRRATSFSSGICRRRACRVVIGVAAGERDHLGDERVVGAGP